MDSSFFLWNFGMDLEAELDIGCSGEVKDYFIRLEICGCKDRESFHYQKPLKSLFVSRRYISGDKWAKFNADVQKIFDYISKGMSLYDCI